MDHHDLAERARATWQEAGHTVTEWSNGPHVRYGTHEHPYRKLLVCVAGSIVFHLESGDHALVVGDELDLAPGTAHAATVGPDGVTCLEAAVQ
ncbi:MAG: cupin [Acidimicrobiia bacterium]|nr:cupin [Acidimicrobiia bacterium]